MNLYTSAMYTNVCHAYRADLENSRVELHLDIDRDLFPNVHGAEVALNNHAGSVRPNTKLHRDKVTTVCVGDAFLLKRSVVA